MSRAQAHDDAVLATLADNIVVRQAVRIARDAEALVSVAAHRDFPEGLAILEPPSGTAEAFTIGSGHLLAVALGCRRRGAAVVVNVAELLRGALHTYGVHEPAVAVYAAGVDAEAAAIHEAAHAAVAPLDDLGDHDRLARVALAARGPDQSFVPEPWLRMHGPTWAVAYAAIAARAIRFRPRSADDLRDFIAADMHAHGCDPAALAEAAAAIPPDACLRRMAADGELLAIGAAAVLPDAERIARAFSKLKVSPSGSAARVA